MVFPALGMFKITFHYLWNAGLHIVEHSWLNLDNKSRDSSVVCGGSEVGGRLACQHLCCISFILGIKFCWGICASVYYHLDRKSRDASAVCIGLGEGEAEKQLIVTSPRKLCKAFVEFVFVSRLL